MNVPDGIRQIGELSKDGVFIYDLDQKRFTYANESFAQYLRDQRNNWQEQPSLILDLIHLEDKTYLTHRFTELQTKRAIQDTEFRLQFPDGTLSHITCDVFLLKETRQIAGFVKDISREKEHEDYIINYGARKDTLLDMLSHNLSGPLLLSQNIMGWVRKEYEPGKSVDITNQLQMIQDNTQHCLDIVNDFLKEEHLESQRIFVKKTRFDLLERIRATLDKLIVTNKDKKFRLITNLESVNINTDSVKFFQVIHNLVSNSIKFTKKHGEIDIIVEELPHSYVIRVADNGIGIPPQFHSLIFEKKTAASRKGLNNEASSGMGLFIVRILVELMDGTVSFTSSENQGSVFSIELPKE